MRGCENGATTNGYASGIVVSDPNSRPSVRDSLGSGILSPPPNSNEDTHDQFNFVREGGNKHALNTKIDDVRPQVKSA